MLVDEEVEEVEDAAEDGDAAASYRESKVLRTMTPTAPRRWALRTFDSKVQDPPRGTRM